MSDRLAALELFVAVAAHGALAPAARALGLGPARASRLLAALEKRLGARLARRTTRALSLTEAGLAFLGPARRAIGELAAAEAALRGARALPAGVLRLSAPTQFGALHVAPLAAELARRHPELSVDLRLADRPVDLIEEGFDAALRVGAGAPGGLIARRVAETAILTLAAPAYLARNGTPKTPADLAAHECVVWIGAGRSVAWRFRAGGKAREIAIAGRVRADAPGAVLAAAIAGAGIARLPEYQARDALADGRLTTVLDAFAPPSVPIAVLYPAPGPGFAVPPKLRVFLDLAVERLGGAGQAKPRPASVRR
ncbi:MAG: LysR family transcriptional regulator [Tagaea sp.]|nr:LysR family transcriptional regulator [Tagaea sp.]